MGEGKMRFWMAAKLRSHPCSHWSFPLNSPASICRCLDGPRNETTRLALAQPARSASSLSGEGASFGSSGARFKSRSRSITAGGSVGMENTRSVTSSVLEALCRNTASMYGFAPAVSTRSTLYSSSFSHGGCGFGAFGSSSVPFPFGNCRSTPEGTSTPVGLIPRNAFGRSTGTDHRPSATQTCASRYRRDSAGNHTLCSMA
mmetsp:Transcript_10386/g.43602  ORF Transcript_10386/g.43602 Transcript_10386/m.43602 type:complete len:202 (-) Transcript_10386:268-873(-)